MASCVDQGLIIRQLSEKIERTTSPRHRAMLERVREHAAAETTGDLEGLMKTLSSDPAYHFWDPEGDTGPKGRDGVEQWYTMFVENRLQFLELDCERIIADDEYVVLEGVIKIIIPGELMTMHPRAEGMEVDPQGHYLLTSRNVTFWPFDDDLLLVGEDSYSGGPMTVRALEDAELPEAYKALFV